MAVLFAFVGARGRRRVFKPRISLNDIPDEDLVSRYRFDRDSIEFICELCREDLQQSNRGHAIEPMTQVLISLRLLCKGDFMSEVADVHGISRASVSRILIRFVKSINKRLKNIRFPQDVRDVKRNFFRKCMFPDVIGAIDGTLIPIIAPRDNPDAYICRKGFHALNVQAVVDANMRFLDVVCRWPGSTHDAAIFENCGLKDHLNQNNFGHLLGDSGYPLKTFLMTPLLNPATQQEERYNHAHSTGRTVVERTFGVLKSRFRCLHKSGGCLPFSPSKSAQIVMACMRLHNLCMDRGFEYTDCQVPDQQNQVVIADAAGGPAIRKRQRIVNTF